MHQRHVVLISDLDVGHFPSLALCLEAAPNKTAWMQTGWSLHHHPVVLSWDDDVHSRDAGHGWWPPLHHLGFKLLKIGLCCLQECCFWFWGSRCPGKWTFIGDDVQCLHKIIRFLFVAATDPIAWPLAMLGLNPWPGHGYVKHEKRPCHEVNNMPVTVLATWWVRYHMHPCEVRNILLELLYQHFDEPISCW